ncbi:hypothetical protein Pyn_07964 [Prunus yedoensis var. nudiflora]|uniref:Uncharacterized protein n=1 Tax=Prunus yedoensis var. nudiflora TaxID=2094558 RepID=A0A314YSI5_PRUYE|nr:hypothetical protein Pyn_07964 [Prunus yedoensis var. nudiflora]
MPRQPRTGSFFLAFPSVRMLSAAALPAGWKLWGHSTGLITFSPLMLAGSTSMVLSCTLIPIFHDYLFSLKMNQTEAIEEANAKEADKVANQLLLLQRKEAIEELTRNTLEKPSIAERL